MKRLPILLALFCSCSATAETPYDQCYKSVVVVLVHDETGDGYRGGGVLVGNRIILTTLHLVDHPGQVTVRYHGGHTTTAKVGARNSKLDLAIVHPDNPLPADAAVVNLTPPKIGDQVYFIGHPHGLEWSLSVGTIAYEGKRRVKLPGDKKPIPVWQADILLAPGSSGGGLFDQEGRLIGIGKGIMQGTSIAFFIPASDACDLVRCKHTP